MAGTPVKLTYQFQTISRCDSLVGWSGDATLDSDPENPYVEGLTSIGIDVDIETNGITYTFPAAKDLTNAHLYFWMNILGAARLTTMENGGFEIRISDGVNTGRWYLAGSDTYKGGWKLFTFWTGTPLDAGTTPNLAVATSVQFYWTCTAKNKATQNAFIDWVRMTSKDGNGMIVTGPKTAGEVWATLEDVFTEDDATAVGIIVKEGGAYILNGPITFGDDSGIYSHFMQDFGKIILFEDQRVAPDFYKIEVKGHHGTTTEFELGRLTRSAGKNLTTEGCIFNVNRPQAGKSVFGFHSTNWAGRDSTLEYTINFKDNNVDKIGLYGCSFSNAGEIWFGTDTTQLTYPIIDIINTSFEKCGSVIVNIKDSTTLEGLVFARCRNRFIPYDATAQGALKVFNLFFREHSNEASLLNPQFISNRRGIEFRDKGEFIIEGATFASNTIDLYFSQVQDARTTVNLINSDDNPSFGQDNGRIWQVFEKTSYNLNVQDSDASNLRSVGVRLSATNTGRSRGQESFSVYTKGGDAQSIDAGKIPQQYVIRRTHDLTWDVLGNANLDSTEHNPFELRVRKYGYIPQKILGKNFTSVGISDSLALQTDDYVYRTNETEVADTTGIIIYTPQDPLDATLFISPHVGKREGGPFGPWQEPPANGEYMRIGLQEVYEWCRWYTAQIENMKLEDVLCTLDGITYNNNHYTIRIDGTAMELVGSTLNLNMPDRYFNITGNPQGG